MKQLRCLLTVALSAIALAGCARQVEAPRAASLDIAETTPEPQAQPPAPVATFGTRQLDQMLDDRPDMKDAIPASHPIYAWVAEGFDGTRFGQRVFGTPIRRAAERLNMS